ncbi:MAG: hypothetical protein ACJ72N_20010 [Labedaea sp.]
MTTDRKGEHTMLMKRARRPVGQRICWTCAWTMSAGVAWPMWASLPGGWPVLRRCRACEPAASLR